MFLDGKKKGLLDEMRGEMQSASKDLQFEVAAQLRDEIHLLETLNLRGDLEANEQPEVFFVVDPKKGMKSLKKSLELTTYRVISKGSTSLTCRARRLLPAWFASSTAFLSSRGTRSFGSRQWPALTTLLRSKR